MDRGNGLGLIYVTGLHPLLRAGRPPLVMASEMSGNMSNTTPNQPLRFVQIGDLHLTNEGLQNHRDFLEIVQQLNNYVGNAIDFVYLPGDNADDGADDQFGLVRAGLKDLRLPWHTIPGDHDFKPRSLDAFYRGLELAKLPYAEDIRGCRCLFLDVVSEGSGGPDFKLSAAQFEWLRLQLDAARRLGRACIVFMHAYPADLGAEAAELSRLLDESNTLLVAMGHTHYNEIAHDGRTIYAVTRSTGQIEEGPVGFSFFAIDDGAVSWRFKPLESPWPFVLITAPADRRLAVHHGKSPVAKEVRASAWGAVPVTRAEFRIDEGSWQPMSIGEQGMIRAPLPDARPRFTLEVRVSDADGRSGVDTIEIDDEVIERASTGSDRNSIGAWPERHLFSTQLGPNRNGRKW